LKGEIGMEEVRYHLYVAPFTQETAQIALNEKYARATPSHVMIYNTNSECPAGYREMTEDDLHLLPDDSLKWLYETNNVIIQQFVAMRMEEQERANKKFLEEFEKEQAVVVQGEGYLFDPDEYMGGFDIYA
jgi:hypothetical protein